jgi:sugar lactone lactonase YvrE
MSSRIRELRCLSLYFVCVLSFAQGQARLQVGYTVMTADPGTTLPVATALFSYTNSAGILVSQAGVAAAEPIASGRIFVDESGTQTGIALVNPSDRTASATLTLRDSAGREVEKKTLSLSAGEHLARYVYQLFAPVPAGFYGTLSFESDQRLAAITLRESRNAQNEPLYTTLPVADLAAPASAATLVFPQIAAGGGYTTQVILVNTSGSRASGSIRFTDSAGAPLALHLNGSDASRVSYSIEPNGAFRADCDRPAGLASGYATVEPEAGSMAPSGSAVFQFKSGGRLVTEAGVGAAVPTTSARIFVDNTGTYTGVALASTSDSATDVRVDLLDRYGSAIDQTSRRLPARGHSAVFAHELFPDLGSSFTGLIEISSPTALAAVTLKLTTNGRGDSVLTTLPVADLTRPLTAVERIFPQIAIGEGFSTRLILINARTATAATGRIRFQLPDGSPMSVPLGGRTDSRFDYDVASGGGRQMLPGNTATPMTISLLDAASGSTTREVTVNAGRTLRPQLRVVDSAGQSRDDFELRFSSLATDIATVDATGSVRGVKAGFSTLTISAGGVVALSTITVCTVSAGASGFDVTGVAQDLARRLYLAATADQTIQLAQDLRQTPAIYAGVSRTAGLRNDLRLQSWFAKPAFLAFDQARGVLYVSDSGNACIRSVQPGPAGKVETLASGFDDPQGIALDNKGNLWVADAGSHTIRRVNLATRAVETIAGRAGSPGSADGNGASARFSSPAGIALESEPLALEIDRERKGLAAPPAAFIVADTGNNVLRRVKENGAVETLVPKTASAAAGAGGLDAPSGVAVDPFGNIYVSEPNSNRVKLVLQTGEIVSATQAGTFAAPRGIAVAQRGKVVVAERGRAAQEVSYGEPAISSVTPSALSSRGGTPITIAGNNFSPDTVVIVGGVRVSAEVRDTRTIAVTAPVLASGQTTVTVQNRAGLAQSSLLAEPVPLAALLPGQITTVAGGTTFLGDGMAATTGRIASPHGMALDGEGNVYFADTGSNRVRRVSARTGVITTVAGTGIYGSDGDGGLASLAQLAEPAGVSIDGSGNLLIADDGNNRVRRVDATTGIITTVAGGGTFGNLGDGGPALQATLNRPRGTAVDSAGNLYIADFANARVRKVDGATKVITTVAGTGQPDFFGDGGPAAKAALASPTGVAVDASGNLFIADLHRVRRVDAATGVITTAAGKDDYGNEGDGGPATSARFNVAVSVSVDSGGALFVADQSNNRIRRVDPASGVIRTVAGTGERGFSGDGALAIDARLDTPSAAAANAAGDLFVVDSGNNRVRKVDAVGAAIRAYAGSGVAASSGDGKQATAASLYFPGGIALDSAATALWIVDTESYVVRKVDLATGIITAAAGSGEAGTGGDGGPAVKAALNSPVDVALDASGNAFITESSSHRVRKVDARTGLISTAAGTDRMSGFSGDGGPATLATLNYPNGVAVDSSGNLYVSDSYNHRIRRIDVATGIITTVAGGGNPAQGIGDGGAPSAALLQFPLGIALDAARNLFIADLRNYRIRQAGGSPATIATVAGNGQNGGSPDGLPATQASLIFPQGIAVDTAGNLFIADYHRVLKVSATTGILMPVAGNGNYGFGGDGGSAIEAAVDCVRLALDKAGNLYISDRINHRVRVVRGPL